MLKAIGLSLAVLRFMNGDETALRRFFIRNREKRGLDALLASMLAQSAGDSKLAIAKAEKAHGLLNRPVMTNLLIAQAAEAKGNSAMAIAHYKDLLDDPRSRFVGIQGLIRSELELGEPQKARALAVKALDMQPAHEATQNPAEVADRSRGLERCTQDAGDQEIQRAFAARRVPAARCGHGAADSDALAAKDNLPRARDAAIEANRLSPDLVPAAVAAAQALVAQGKRSSARKVIKAGLESSAAPRACLRVCGHRNGRITAQTACALRNLAEDAPAG